MKFALTWWWAERCNAYEENYWSYVAAWDRYLSAISEAASRKK